MSACQILFTTEPYTFIIRLNTHRCFMTTRPIYRRLKFQPRHHARSSYLMLCPLCKFHMQITLYSYIRQLC